MSVGLQVTKGDVDTAAGICARQAHNTFQIIKQFKTWLDTQTDANLIVLGYVQAEVNTLRSAMVDLDKLRTVFEGTGTQTPAYDFRQFSKLLLGTGIY